MESLKPVSTRTHCTVALSPFHTSLSPPRRALRSGSFTTGPPDNLPAFYPSALLPSSQEVTESTTASFFTSVAMAMTGNSTFSSVAELVMVFLMARKLIKYPIFFMLLTVLPCNIKKPRYGLLCSKQNRNIQTLRYEKATHVSIKDDACDKLMYTFVHYPCSCFQ